MKLIDKIFGTHSQRELKRIEPIVQKVESYDEAMQKLSDEELKHKTIEFKERLANGETLDDILPEAMLYVEKQAGVYLERNISVYKSLEVSFFIMDVLLR